ncbi:polyribonucleotide nucleotidyltransferase [Texas Phoenix palm phytoplasma]|uniref:Polyribonucleotide nucleotidyltransferase n=1 Tax=Texas Phoenix palm phytoplasma TaxID=176709 RepID=A0ABS5BL17_9MOLU|nr:polyribonucleotide nucleotidyltransferase [Texas Phoenix palm phytoplasma]MBP3059457.1 polyribonucleotide nucleotidyltransferase [Texas Phoenix palm phytoplasma]
MNSYFFETIFENNLLTVEINKLAKQSSGNVLVRYKDTVILSVSVLGKNETLLNYFPLMVIYQEKLYAVGKIPGSFSKREGKLSDQEILNSRLIDRTIRPLFSHSFRQEIQVVNTVLSSDDDCNNEIFAILGSSLSLILSEIPFNEPVAGICIGKIEDKFIINPDLKQKEKSDFILILSGTKNSLNMIEAIANEISESDLLEAMVLGHKKIQELCIFQEKIKEKINPKKIIIPLQDSNIENLSSLIEKKYISRIKDVLRQSHNDKISKNELNLNIEKLKKEILDNFKNNNISKELDSNLFFLEKNPKYFIFIEEIFHSLVKKEIRNMIIKNKLRIDGRKIDEIRNIKSEIKVLPRAHGSAIFTRGQTQSLSVVTLGTLRESKLIDDLTQEEQKRFIVHYNFPPFSVGEIGRYMMVSRREIGHGILAEKALSCVLPTEDEFPYTIRVVSEILESNGSSSQATICATSMALMDAGVPLKKSVAGIAMGLFFDEETKEYVILSDIQGLEDHTGDMDLKVSGTEKGITALQMDIKIKYLEIDILKECLKRAKLGRIEILKEMSKIIDKPKKDLSLYAPKVKIIHIPIHKIRDVIGSGGKIISQIISNYDNVKIDIEQDGRIIVMHQNIEMVQKAVDYILDLVKEVKVGEFYRVTVLKILSDKFGKSFGVIVSIFPNVEGFIHFTKMNNIIKFKKIEDFIQKGNKLLTKCIKISEKGKVFLSLESLEEK